MGTPEFAAISAVAVRHNDISHILSTAPSGFAPIYRRKPNREVDARPWCEGFYAAMKLRMPAWAPLLNTDEINQCLLLPMRKAYTDIPAVVEPIRQYWMPIRYRRDP